MLKLRLPWERFVDKEKEMKVEKKQIVLYGITDTSWLHGKTLYELVEEALKGGVTMLQYREKKRKKEEFIEEAKQILQLCQQYHVPFIMNDDVELAKEIGADGVHVGAKDMSPKQARAILGEDKIIGVSARTVEDALQAEQNGADYIGSGAVFTTGTKKDAKPLEKEVLKQICESVRIPVVAIGGIAKENVEQLENTSISGIAVVSALFAAEDVKKEAQDLKQLVNGIVNEVTQ